MEGVHMVSDFVDIPTDVLLDLVVTLLDVGRWLTSTDAAELRDLQCELQRRLQDNGWEC